MKEKTPWMEMAILLAQRAEKRGEVPVAGVLVHGNHCIARAHNQVKRFGTPLAHAEMLLILMGQKRLKSSYLSECDLYVTLEPCALCFAALSMARIRRIYFGAYATRATLGNASTLARPFSTPEVMGGFHEKRCASLLHAFFKPKR
jgi:tRNA(adenine34) deaminase